MRSLILAPLLLWAAFAMAPAQAASTVTLAPALGHPSLPVTISGSGFGASEAIDVYLDTVDTLLLVSSATGTFSGSVTISASAQPGRHYITAVGRHSGDAAQGAFTVATPWAEQGYGGSHLGWNPYENTLNTGNVSSLGVLWRLPVVGGGGAVAVSSGRVFVGTEAGVEAVTAATGAVLWKSLPGSSFEASPAVFGTTLYIGDTSNPNMYALNATTGAVIWSQATGGFFYSSPVVAGGLVYAGGQDGKIYAFSATTGKIAWTYTTAAFIDASPAVAAGIVYVGSTDNKVYALNATTGALVWSYTTGGGVESAVAVANGVVYVGSDDDKLYALSANSGSLLWSYATGGPVYSSPAFAKGVVYFGSADYTLYAANAHSGAILWKTSTDGLVGAPVVANGVIYATSRNNSFFAMDASNGQILETGAAGYSFLGNPTVSDGVVYLNSFNSNLYAFSLLAGTNAAPAPAQPPHPSTLHPDLSLVVVR